MLPIDGPVPIASIYSTWTEQVEVFSVDDDTRYDFSGVTEITLKLQDQLSRFDELTLKMSSGEITLPAPGIVQWRAEAGAMGVVRPKLYKILMIFEVNGDTVPLIIGTVSVIE